MVNENDLSSLQRCKYGIFHRLTDLVYSTVTMLTVLQNYRR